MIKIYDFLVNNYKQTFYMETKRLCDLLYVVFIMFTGINAATRFLSRFLTDFNKFEWQNYGKKGG